MTQFVIRPERQGDIQAIGQVTKAAFAQAAHSSHTEHFIVDALRREGALALSLVAEEAGQVLGHLALSPVTLTPQEDAWLGLGPISVYRRGADGGSHCRGQKSWC
ncbi:GNAT family N-acetyltransferase [Gallaecimonas xiamenensis]|uniref:Acetyltransferase n=1 Tax=Gallaecimonas xiamenensis 3-C-1 TaxID=745411 RepID=K2K8Y7_9GAMM|nr:acetyltransferase [Gallaecimonas xiamenensis 3-C-1]